MGTIELKSSIHKIVEGIDNEQLLQTLHDFLKAREANKPGDLWESLSYQQKNEVLVAFQESEEKYHLIEREKVFKKD